MRVSLAILSAVLAFIQAHMVAAQVNSSVTDTAAVVTVTTAAVISSSMVLPPLQSSVTLSEILTAPSRPSAMLSASFPAATQEFPSHPTVGSSSAQKTGTPSSPDENAGAAVASSNRWLFAGCALVVVSLTNAVVL